jgi:mRNA interferase MazF
MSKRKQGDIWMANLNPNFRSEIGKVRPVVIVQTDNLNDFHSSTIICPISAKIIEENTPIRVKVNKRDSGVEHRSDILVDQIRAIDNSRFKKRIGRIPDTSLRELKDLLKKILDLD